MRPISIVLAPVVLFSLLLGLFAVWSGSESFALQSSPPAKSISAEPKEPLLSELIERERKKWGLPKGVIEGLIFHESRFDETAFNPERKSNCYRRAKTPKARRACGSDGLMQTVSRWHGGHAREPLEKHIARGVNYLGSLYQETKSVVMALEKYNRGPKARGVTAYSVEVLRNARGFGYTGLRESPEK